jgi:ribosomal protein S18 acetylase RimI-like enzyme
VNNRVLISKAVEDDLQEILDLQKLAYVSEAIIYDDYTIQPLCQTLKDLQKEFKSYIFLKATIDTSIIGSVRANRKNNTCYIEKLIVSPEYQNQGIGTKLMSEIENCFPNFKRFELFTGKKSIKNIHLYEKLGYVVFREKRISDNLTFIFMKK